MNSPPARRLKAVLRERDPDRYARLKRGLDGARRAMREPPAPRLDDERLFWDPPPRRIPLRDTRAGEVTELLYARLGLEDVEEVARRLEGEDAERWAAASESERKLLALPFGVHHRVPAVLEKTGLSPADPPGDVTAMGRGSLAAGGSSYYADLVAEALRTGGSPLEDGQRVLDFGASSGRVVRVLAAAYPGIEWHACDPDAPAIEWAQANLEGIHFFVADPDPPLPFPDGHLDAVAAIGIWTSYSESAALRWLEEMRRVIRPGGLLVLTTHGLQSVELHAGEWGGWDRRRIAEVATAMYTEGFKFVGAYGKEGQHHRSTPDWGQAFMTAEWVAARACPSWSIVEFEPARAEGNLDLYVLLRR